MFETHPIRRDDAAAEIGRYIESLRKHVSFADPLRYVGHRLGATKLYPKSFENDARRPDPVVELMNEAYECGLTSVELDIRTLHLDGETPLLCVAHDPLPAGGDLSDDALDYLRKNSFDVLFQAYLDCGHYQRDRQLAIEIKVDDADPLPQNWLEYMLGIKDELLEDTVKQLVAKIEGMVEGRSDAAAVRRSIRFVSFNYKAVKLAYERAVLETSKEVAAEYGYFLITSTNIPGLNVLAVLDDATSPLSQKLIGKIGRAPWLDGVWYDPRFVLDSEELFSAIQKARDDSGLAPLEIHVSTYYSELSELVNHFEKGKGRLEISGLVFDLE